MSHFEQCAGIIRAEAAKWISNEGTDILVKFLLFKFLTKIVQYNDLGATTIVDFTIFVFERKNYINFG